METQNTAYMHTSVILQNAVFPNFVAVWQTVNKQLVFRHINLNFNEAIDGTLKEANLCGKEAYDLFFNIGPGSYTGIRQAFGFALGTAAGKSKIRYFPFTSFHIVHFLLGIQKADIPTFIQGLPPIGRRKGRGERARVRGYANVGTRFLYTSLEEFLKKYKNSAVYIDTNDRELTGLLSPTTKVLTPQQAHRIKENIPNLVEFLTQRIAPINASKLAQVKPLYINPVNITTPKSK